MNIHRIGMAHFDAIVQFNKLCFPLDPWPEEDWKMLLEDDRSLYYALMEQDQIIGCVFIYNWQGERDYVKIMDMAIHPEHRNRGYARQLLNYVTDQMAPLGMACFRGETRQSNKAMQHVFALCGYQKYAEEADYYDHPTETAYQYVLQL